MRKLRILNGDEGDWTMNRDTLRILKENGLEEPFMQVVFDGYSAARLLCTHIRTHTCARTHGPHGSLGSQS